MDTSSHYFDKSTILIADDEKAVRDMLVLMLEKFGYAVLVAEDGQQAVELFEQHHRKVDLVIMDVLMPHLDGIKAYKEMAGINPDLDILFISAYTADYYSNIGLDFKFIKKPFSASALLAKIKECGLPRPAASI